jgi:CheY-like chemotaxis protein
LCGHGIFAAAGPTRRSFRQDFRLIQLWIDPAYIYAMHGTHWSRQEVVESVRAALVVVIDDDPLALDAIGGLLRSWGLEVVAAASDGAALAQLAKCRQSPRLLICDYHLADGRTGIEAIERLRAEFQMPAILISGDAGAGFRREADRGGYRVLHKPVDPKALRALLDQVL